jgi:hypothetical protein
MSNLLRDTQDFTGAEWVTDGTVTVEQAAALICRPTATHGCGSRLSAAPPERRAQPPPAWSWVLCLAAQQINDLLGEMVPGLPTAFGTTEEASSASLVYHISKRVSARVLWAVSLLNRCEKMPLDLRGREHVIVGGGFVERAFEAGERVPMIEPEIAGSGSAVLAARPR